MREVMETVRGKITSYNPETGEMVIKAYYPDWQTALKREYKEVKLEMVDSRPLSSKQRNACYAMLGEIAEFCGISKAEAKDLAKIEFLSSELGRTADSIFSLSDGAMSLVCAFQRFLVRFIVDHSIPCSHRLLDWVDDIPDYIYGCLLNKRCCVCGKPADLHHWDRVGAGNNRLRISHIGLKAEPLCREHHTECHNIGQEAFDSLYHIEPVEIDKAIAKIYGLNTKSRRNVMAGSVAKGEQDAEQSNYAG